MVHLCMSNLMTHHSQQLVSIWQMVNQCITDNTFSVAPKPFNVSITVAVSFINNVEVFYLAATSYRRILNLFEKFLIYSFQVPKI